ncbi:MAG TPA: putative capsular polysaccharide synthesis family protein, partial [Thermoanaerobaculia bacterium]
RLRATRAALGWHVAPSPPPHDLLGLELRDRLVRRGRRCRVITLVRDPIARNISSYFEHLDAIWNRTDAHASVPLDDLHRGFLERFPHDEPLTWFDDELLPVLGIDVHDHSFPSAGSLRIGDVLIMKSELEDAVKSAALRDFLGLRRLTVQPTNSTGSKSKGETYRHFLATIRLEQGFVDRMLESRYTRHFYTEAERDAMRRKYLAPSTI